MTTKYTFKQEYPGYTGFATSAPPSTVTMEINGEISLPQVLERFEEFLRGAGFHFDGHLDFVNDEIYTEEETNIDDDTIHIFGEPTVTFGSMDDNMNINLNAGAATETFVINTEDHSPYFWDTERNK